MSLVDFVATPKFEEYKERFKQHYKLERREDGVILAQAHTAGGPIQLSVENHRSVGQLFKTIGADPQNEVMIFAGSGKEFMMDADPEGFKLEQEDLQHWAYEYAYKDGRINVSALVNDLEIPTIGLVNGPGFHTEIVTMCDITIAAEDAVFGEPELKFGAGIVAMMLPWLVGVKRAKEIILTGEDKIPAREALAMGMVNRLVKKGEAQAAALKMARHIAVIDPGLVQKTKRAINRSLEIAGLMDALEDALLIDLAIEGEGSPDKKAFMDVARKEGLRAAIAWRDARFNK